MPSTLPSRQVRTFRHASDLPKDVWRALFQNEVVANIIFPFAKKALSLPRGGNDEQLWIVVYDDAKAVEFVLSCTHGPLGKYPIFIVASKSSAQLAHEEKLGKHLIHTLSPLVRCLLQEVPPQRVFSVFSIARVTEVFAEIFQSHTRQQYGIQALEDPYYDATFTFCTRDTLRKVPDAVSWAEDVVISLRRAAVSDIGAIRVMCKAFSETSPPFVLDDASAELEAKLLIENKQAWVHIVQKGGEAPEIACLVATTRESENVTAVTKVFTAAHWRGRGCAARLMHRVCDEILQQKERVVLYVGNSDELAPARKVYHKIGFQGLDGKQVKDVDKWLEIGFTGTTLGHW